MHIETLYAPGDRNPMALPSDELPILDETAAKRTESNIRNQRVSKEGPNTHRSPAQIARDDRQAVRTERVFFRFMGLYDRWPTFFEHIQDFADSLDLEEGKFEVRSTHYNPGMLIVRTHELPRRDMVHYVLVRAEGENLYRVVGWCYGWQARKHCPKPYQLNPDLGFPPSHNVRSGLLQRFKIGHPDEIII